MDFNYKRFSHLFAMLLLLGTIFLIIIYPLLAFLGFFPLTVIPTRSRTFDKIVLDDFIDDDNSITNITWDYTGDTYLQVEIKNRIAHIIPPKNWNGTETITFIATDSKNLSNAIDVTFSLNEGYRRSFLGNIENRIILKNDTFKDIELEDYLVNNYTTSQIIEWNVSGNSNIEINIFGSIAKITYPSNFTGFEIIDFYAIDENGKKSLDTVVFIVNNDSGFPNILKINDQEKIYVEFPEFMLIFSSLITISIFIVIPLIWYLIVNGYSIKKILHVLKIRFEGIDNAVLWGFIGAVIMVFLIIILGNILFILGVDEENLSNVSELAENLSFISMLFIIVFQSISEEIFFRGFLLEKIDMFAGTRIAIISTAVLFGLAHLTYGKIYPAVVPMIMGVLLGYLVVKTKNLFSAIIAHILLNFTSFIIYFYAKSLGF
jgi:membrane protease YdiL (CAAX protease family)